MTTNQPRRAMLLMLASRILTVFLVGIAVLTPPLKTSRADGGRFLAVFVTGERSEGERITGWHAPNGTPMLDSTSLRSNDRDLRWLRDRSLALPSQHDARGSIEFVGGDRLPGEPIAFVEASDDGTPAHLLVQTDQNINHPTEETRQLVRVNLEYVRGIHWGIASQGDGQPSTILLVDGRRVSYRALTWLRDAVRVLTSEGVMEFPFAKISRLRLPAKDFWTVYYKELATLCPNVSTRLVRLETTSSLVATSSELRFDAISIVSPQQRQRAEVKNALIVRHQQRRRAFVAKQQAEERKLAQKLKEYQRKRDQQLRKLQNDLRNMRNRMKKMPADEVARRVKEFDERNRKRIEEQATRLSKNYKAIIARNIQRHRDRVRDVDKQIKQVEQDGINSSDVGGSPEQWYHMVHPAWSLDPLWLQFNSIRTRWSFAPHEVPLSRLEPSKTVQRSTLGSGWNWQANRNVRGSALRNAGSEYGWGFGVHATNELHFSIPSFATSFRSLVGLDDTVGSGGCIRVEVRLHAADNSRVLYKSEFLTGSERVLNTGTLNLADADVRPQSLVLIIDAAHQNRPSGADPLDIRDHADWLEPILELDAAALQAEIQKHKGQ